MPLIEDINRAIAESMKARDQARLVPLRMLKAALMNREVERGRPLDDIESRQVVSSLVKQRRDSIEQFEKGGRADLAAKERAEIVVVERYLPAAMGSEDMTKAVDALLAELGITEKKDLGRAMKEFMARHRGRVDGKTANALIASRLK
jgi:uncharacterized protein YqeY